MSALEAMKQVAPTFQSVEDFPSEEEDAQFVIAFRRMMRTMNVLQSYTDFDWDDLPIDEEEYEEYKIKYLKVYDRVKMDRQKNKTSVLDDIDFELELIHRDHINVSYIIRLLAKMKHAKKADADAQKKAILDLIGGDVSLRSKRELIEKFIEENLPKIDDVDTIEDEFEAYWQDQKVLALAKICEEEKLDKGQFNALIEAYIYSGKEPIRDDINKCLAERPSILAAKAIGLRILDKMKKFIEVFVQGMVG
jgi:type I restriction enzyme R subunit